MRRTVLAATIMLAASPAATAAAPTFATHVEYAADIATKFVAAGDLNGDAKLDLVATNVGYWYDTRHSVSVLLGNGNGTFQTKTDYPTGSLTPEAVAIADINGDGKPDLVTANDGSEFVLDDPSDEFSDGHWVDYNSVSVLLGNGDGTFQTHADYTTGSGGPQSVAVGDVNADGKPDVLVGTYNPYNVSVLLGNGNGTLQAHTEYATNGGTRSIALADVNADGNPDVLTANLYSSTASVLLGDGNGTFQTHTDYTTGGTASAVAVADVNGDGKLDMVTADYDTSKVSVFLGNGNGTFGAKTDFAAGSTPASVAISDINGDGKLDLVTSNLGDYPNYNVSVLLGNGDGTFGTKTNFASAAGPNWVIAADFNGDGLPDLATANGAGNVSVLLSPGTVTVDLHVTKTASPAANVVNGDPMVWTVTVSNQGANDDTSANVTDTMPAGVTGTTWTCAASSGSSCAHAGGSGSIAEAGSTIKAGGSLTYTISATVLTSASGNLVNTASATPGSGFSDSDSSDDSATATTAVQRDTTAPVTTDDVPASYVNHTVTVTLTATDSGGSRVDKTYYTTGTSPVVPTINSAVYNPASKPTLADGQKIRYFSTDVAGNAETAHTSSAAQVDTAAPTTTDDVPASYVNHTVTVTLTATDTGGSGVNTTYYTTDGTTPTSSSTEYDPAHKPTLDNSERIKSFSVDNAGNAETVQISGTARVDAQAPETQLDSAYVSTTGDASFVFSASDAAPSSGGVSYQCRLDTAAYAPCTSPKVLTGVTVGDHSFDIKATDAVGNEDATPSHYSFTVAPAATTGTVTESTGGTVSTDPDSSGPTASDPVQTDVTTPVAGTVTITETTVSDPAPTGFSFVGSQFVIEAPVATETAPLKLVFKLAGDALPDGTTPDSIVIYRNGSPAAPCTGSSTATPDPCVSDRRMLSDGTIVITVLAVHASTWNLSIPAPASQSTPASPDEPSPPTPSQATPRPARRDDSSLSLLVTNLRVNRRCVHDVTLRSARRGRHGLSFSFRLSGDAIVRYDIMRRVHSPVWRICPPTGGTIPITFAGIWHTVDHQRAGDSHTTLGSAALHKSNRVSAAMGRHHVALAHLAGGRRLSPGTYLLRIIAANANGTVAAPVTVKFWVIQSR